MKKTRRRTAPILLLASAVAACGDPAGPPPPAAEALAVVVNSVDRSLTIVPLETPSSAVTVGLAPDGSPVSVAVRAGRAVVPMGTLPSAVVVDLATRRVVHTVGLPAGSGASAVGFLNDSVALVANTELGSVSPVNVRSGARGAELAVGVYPTAVAAANDTAWVVNARLDETFTPAGPATISVVTGDPLRVVRTVQLTGINPLAATFGADGRLYVLHAGGAEPGSLSAVDRRALEEVAHDTGFGTFPGGLAASPDGRLAVGAFAYGVAIWNPATRTFIRSPDDAIAPGGVPSASGVGFDADGRLYALAPECRTAGRLFRLTGAGAVELEVPVGICPFAMAFGTGSAEP